MNLAAWVLGTVGVILNLIIYQQTTSKRVLLFKLLSDIVWAVQYLLLGAYTGCCIACVAVLREAVFYKVDRKSRTGVACLGIFTAVSLLSAALTWSSALSLLPAVASVISVFAFYFAIPRLSRILALPISLCMGIYALTVGSYLGVVNEMITVASALVGILFIDLWKKKKKGVRVSAIHWDCSLPSTTYFGYHQTRTLSPQKYRTVTPFYADVLDVNKIDYHVRTQEEYDKELEYAIQAGIDYFSYVFYPDAGSRAHVSTSPSDCSHRVYELNYARRMHQSSALRSKIGMAAIMGPHPFAEADYLELAELLKQPYYEKLNGRPIVFFFRQINPKDIAGVRNAVTRLGGVQPLFFVMFNRLPPEDADYSLVDGISAYACSRGDVTSYSELLEISLKDNEARAQKCRLAIPLFPTGWNPAPRMDIPSPWVNYKKRSYAKHATPAELVAGAKTFSAWIKASLGDRFAGHIMIFAWNEFEEGGWICPTYNEDLTVNTERVTAVAQIVKEWKKEL
ncbi:MAG: YgjV family protein [Clostridia bacterium]|nr:YgjV family protein [Clostridia bacterium]